MKKIFHQAAGILLLGISQCAPAMHHHFYVGGGLATQVENNVLRLDQPTGGGMFETSYDNGNLFGAQAQFGYHRVLSTYRFIAAEAGLRLMFGRSSGHTLNYNINTPRVAMPMSVSITLKPGVMITEGNLVYLQIGGIVSNISMYQTYSHKHLTMNVWRPGVLLGLGMQIPLVNQYSINFNYDYEWYQPVFKYFAFNKFTDQLMPRDQVIAVNIVKALD